MIRRPPRSTLSSSSAASDVYKRQGTLQEKGRFLEPRPPLGQNASPRAGIEKETEGITPSIFLSVRQSRFEKPALFPKDPRVDGSKRGGPGLPDPGGRAAPGEPARANRLQMRKLPRPNPSCRLKRTLRVLVRRAA